jgi:hypothetical protein
MFGVLALPPALQASEHWHSQPAATTQDTDDDDDDGDDDDDD